MIIQVRRVVDDIVTYRLLSQHYYTNWDDVFAYLRSKIKNLDVDQYRGEIEAHPDSQLTVSQMVCSGAGGYLANVQYDIRIVAETGEEFDLEPVPHTTPAAAQAEDIRVEGEQQRYDEWVAKQKDAD